ncbi:ORF6N domain-containing protein [Roseobacteraceae bacterium NS-SX3]
MTAPPPPAIIDFLGPPVILDREAARLFGVETRVVNQQVARHSARFTPEFVMRLSTEETKQVRSHFVTSRPDMVRRLRKPNAFTEEGVILLATVLNSDAAVRATKQVIRTFVEVQRLSRDGENRLPVPASADAQLPEPAPGAFRSKIDQTVKKLANVTLSNAEQAAVMAEATQFKDESLNALHAWLKSQSLANAERVARIQRELAEAERARAEAASLMMDTRERERLALIRELLLTLDLERARSDGDYSAFSQTLKGLLK